jgi:hypothetical protein
MASWADGKLKAMSAKRLPPILLLPLGLAGWAVAIVLFLLLKEAFA